MSGDTLVEHAARNRGRRRNILTGGPDLDPKSLADLANLGGRLPAFEKEAAVAPDLSELAVPALHRGPPISLSEIGVTSPAGQKPGATAVRAMADGGRTQPLSVEEILRRGRARNLQDPVWGVIGKRTRGQPSETRRPNLAKAYRRFLVNSYNDIYAAQQSTSPRTD